MLVAEVETQPSTLNQHLGQRRNIAEAKVQPLSRDRMDRMRCVADQREALRGDLRSMVEAERKGRARSEHLDLAEEPAHRGLSLGGEILVAQRQPASGIILGHRPHDRGAVPGSAVVHR